MYLRARYPIACLALVCAPAVSAAWVLRTDDSEQDPIRYSATKPDDPVARLQRRIDAGQLNLSFEPGRGYLASVLRALAIPPSSQMLVFSKTSFQREYISPSTPRAVYFGSSTFIGFVQGAPVLEFATQDPQLGAVFYVLEQTKTAKPRFTRLTHECLQCHESGMTKGVPGHLMRSVVSDQRGQPIFTAGTFITTDQSPFRERWGGWYVTGTHGSQRHLGNLMVSSQEEANLPDLEPGANLKTLKGRVDTTPYLGSHSDIVALMVAEHESSLLNLIARANHQTRIALHYEQALNRELGRPADTRAESTMSRIKSVAEPLARAMMFLDEPPLTDAVNGTSGFTAHFGSQGPLDRKGRSLYHFDLKTRLFRYPLSYLVYSEPFKGLPAEARNYVYRRFAEVLGGSVQTPVPAHLTDADRRAALEILAATDPDFGSFVRPAG